ncbi:tectonin domain-containing protein [Kribbella ginsengisoli]|uniref:PLL-like beta propeller domain-containing protein n=1 Tax=Kribbella ginsengisoli TaxID=363865 RepID=A0ABP6Z9P3_9ACTN
MPTGRRPARRQWNAALAALFALFVLAGLVRAGTAPASAAQAGQPIYGQGTLALVQTGSSFYMFGVDKTDRIWWRQTSGADGTTGWSAWQQLSGSLRGITAVLNSAGLIELYGVNADGNVYRSKQVAPSVAYWTPWTQLSGQMDSIAAIRDYRGRINLFGTSRPWYASWSSSYRRVETAAGSGAFRDWMSFGTSVRSIAATAGPDQRMHIFGVTDSDKVLYKQEVVPGTIEGWRQIGESFISIAASTGGDGRIVVFGTDRSDRLWQMMETAPKSGQWMPPMQIDGSMRSVATGANVVGRVVLVGVNRTGDTFARKLVGEFWTPWSQLVGAL